MMPGNELAIIFFFISSFFFNAYILFYYITNTNNKWPVLTLLHFTLNCPIKESFRFLEQIYKAIRNQPIIGKDDENFENWRHNFLWNR